MTQNKIKLCGVSLESDLHRDTFKSYLKVIYHLNKVGKQVKGMIS